MIEARHIWFYGDNINTDYIFPGVYTYTLMTEDEMGRHAMEGIDKEFTTNAAPGDIIVCGKNWGCGSSREQAVKCLKNRQIAAIISKGFSRIFYRNAINEGFPAIICPEAAEYIKPGMCVSIDLDNGKICCDDRVFIFPPYPDIIQSILNVGGLVPYVKAQLMNRTRG